MSVSFLEIYDETIRDLLGEEGKEEGNRKVKVDASGRRFVSKLTMCPLDPNSEHEVEDVMREEGEAKIDRTLTVRIRGTQTKTEAPKQTHPR